MRLRNTNAVALQYGAFPGSSIFQDITTTVLDARKRGAGRPVLIAKIANQQLLSVLIN